MSSPQPATSTSRRTRRLCTDKLLPAVAVALAAVLQTSVAAHAIYCVSRDDCDDGNACTADVCRRDTLTCSHFSLCNDDNPCTKDRCRPAIGCIHTEIDCTPPAEGCGDANEDGNPTTIDALIVLRTAVGSGIDICTPCVCDVTNDGNITANDSLNILKFAVGGAIYLDCPQC